MKLSRRQFLHRTAFGSAFAFLPPSLLAKDRPTLLIPPLLEAKRGRPIRLDFRPTQVQLVPGKWTETWGANGQHLAPTVRVKSNDFVKLTYVNNLDQSLSIHIQGLPAYTAMLESHPYLLAPKQSWSPVVNVQQSACTGWYHADTLLNAASQIYRGVAGLWLIEEDNARTHLPNHYGVNDIPLILQDHLIDKKGNLVFHSAPYFWGKRLFVNGKENPRAVLPRGWVRLRLLNASVSRHYDLQLDNGKPFYVIATGVGMLAEPLAVQQVSLVPGERVEMLVNLSDGKTVSLITGAKRSFWHRVGQLFQDSQTLVDNVVLEMHPTGLPPALHTEPQLPPRDLRDFHLHIAQERRFHLLVQDALINQQKFDPTRIDAEVKKGTVERWYLSASETIGFTLQGAKFVLETRNRQRVANHLLAWRDTIRIEKEEEITVLVKFDHKAGKMRPFRFGASEFSLRDKGMMGQFTVN